MLQQLNTTGRVFSKITPSYCTVYVHICLPLPLSLSLCISGAMHFVSACCLSGRLSGLLIVWPVSLNYLFSSLSISKLSILLSLSISFVLLLHTVRKYSQSSRTKLNSYSVILTKKYSFRKIFIIYYLNPFSGFLLNLYCKHVFYSLISLKKEHFPGSGPNHHAKRTMRIRINLLSPKN